MDISESEIMAQYKATLDEVEAGDMVVVVMSLLD
jgi:hypothetical protein